MTVSKPVQDAMDLMLELAMRTHAAEEEALSFAVAECCMAFIATTKYALGMSDESIKAMIELVLTKGFPVGQG